MFTQVTKANFQADSVGRIPDLLRQAFREATSGTPAPVNLLFAGKEGDIEHDEAELKLIAGRGLHSRPRVPARSGSGACCRGGANFEGSAKARDRGRRRRTMVRRRSRSFEAGGSAFDSCRHFTERFFARARQSSALHRCSGYVFAFVHEQNSVARGSGPVHRQPDCGTGDALLENSSCGHARHSDWN